MRLSKLAMVGVVTLSINQLAYADAVEIDAMSLLNQYNLITSGNVISTSEIDGNALIGGNVNGGMYNMHSTSNVAVPSLTVGGDLKGSVQTKGKGLNIGGDVSGSLTINDGGDAYIGSVSSTGRVENNANRDGSTSVVGDISGRVNTNGGNTTFGGTNTGFAGANGGYNVSNQPVSVPFDPATAAANAVNTLGQFSNQLAGTDFNSNYTITGGKVTFNATPNTDGLAVFNINDGESFFTSVNEFAFNIGSATSILFNVFDDALSGYDISVNFLANSAVDLADILLWNFTDADSLHITSQFGGSILALGTDVVTHGNIEGTLAAKTLNQNAEIHSQPSGFVPPSAVPVPAAAFLFAPALLGFLGLRRKANTVKAAA
ncbi:choice-of-anchor A family protein [Methylophaga sp. UBA678]|uniref:choice-of-anchor A family protein n=1 Tax=Methylophaga sp. UBA678 TaxID=1946901 RepID=UPI00259D043B|nr:choice-of-anchor A family protein [Methylophaga sp. UBA678]